MLHNALTITMIVFFIHVCFTWQGMVFKSIGEWLERRLPEYIYKPLIGCPICMSPWWGYVLYCVFHFAGLTEFSERGLIREIGVVFVAAGFSVVLVILSKWHEQMVNQEETFGLSESEPSSAEKALMFIDMNDAYSKMYDKYYRNGRQHQEEPTNTGFKKFLEAEIDEQQHDQ